MNGAEMLAVATRAAFALGVFCALVCELIGLIAVLRVLRDIWRER